MEISTRCSAAGDGAASASDPGLVLARGTESACPCASHEEAEESESRDGGLERRRTRKRSVYARGCPDERRASDSPLRSLRSAL